RMSYDYFICALLSGNCSCACRVQYSLGRRVVAFCPTRRSSDLVGDAFQVGPDGVLQRAGGRRRRAEIGRERQDLDQFRPGAAARSEEHTSELHSRSDLVCRLLLEKKKIKNDKVDYIIPLHNTYV